jgi:hypothetical protein
MQELEYDTSEELGTTLDQSGIRVHAEFVPWSQSRKGNGQDVKSASVKDLSLNWRVSLHVDGHEALATDYTAGIGHCPGYSAKSEYRGWPLSDAAVIRAECEKGIPHRFLDHASGIDVRPLRREPAIMPKAEDVLHSLLLDSDAIEHSSFENWAADFGYDEDSRKAEAIYRACLEIGLKLRNAFGDAKLQELRDLFQDY